MSRKRNDILDDILIDSTDSDEEQDVPPAKSAPTQQVAPKASVDFVIDSSDDEAGPEEQRNSDTPARTAVSDGSSSPKEQKVLIDSEEDTPSPQGMKQRSTLLIDSDDESSTDSNHTPSIAPEPEPQSLDEQEGPTVNSRGFSTTAAAPTAAADTQHMSAWSESDEASSVSLSDGSPLLKGVDDTAEVNEKATVDAEDTPHHGTTQSIEEVPAVPPRMVESSDEEDETRPGLTAPNNERTHQLTATALVATRVALHEPEQNEPPKTLPLSAINPQPTKTPPSSSHHKELSIYDRAVKTEERRQRWLSSELEKKKTHTDPECTFAPKISKFASQQERTPQNLWRNERKEAKEKLYRQTEGNEADALYSFKPSIGYRTKRIVRKLRSQSENVTIPVEERLYFDRERRAAESSAQRSHRSFVEQTNQIGCRAVTDDDAIATVNRLHSWKEDRDAHVEFMRRQYSSKVESVDEVVERLTSTQTPALDVADELLYSPQIREETSLLREVKRQKNLEKWFQFLADDDGLICVHPPPQAASKNRTAVRIVHVLRCYGPVEVAAFALDTFIDVLCSYEQQYGPQRWSHSVPSKATGKKKKTTYSFTPKLTSATMEITRHRPQSPQGACGRLYKQETASSKGHRTRGKEVMSATVLPSPPPKPTPLTALTPIPQTPPSRHAVHDTVDILESLDAAVFAMRAASPPPTSSATNTLPNELEDESLLMQVAKRTIGGKGTENKQLRSACRKMAAAQFSEYFGTIRK